MTSLVIEKRFNGPATTGNGGYSAGLFAENSGLSGDIQVSLKAPPPLGESLTVMTQEETADLMWEGRSVAHAEKTVLSLDIPNVPVTSGGFDLDLTRPQSGGPQSFEGCFVCGRQRDHGDGLCLYSYPVRGVDRILGARWTLYEGLADEQGHVRPRYIWSALDCPGYFACANGVPALLARLTVHQVRPLSVDGEAWVLSWPIGDGEGRKRHCGTAILDKEGDLIAYARGLWVVVDEAYLARIAGESAQ